MPLAELREHVQLALHHGDSLDEVEAEIIDPAPLHEEQKAALWLFGAAVARSGPKSPPIQPSPAQRDQTPRPRNEP